MLDESTSDSIRTRLNDVRERVKNKSSSAKAQQALNAALSTKPSKEVQKTLNSLAAKTTLDDLRAQRSQRAATK
jgi:uncharacterized protein involved in exopolysaccharide biosynthesis